MKAVRRCQVTDPAGSECGMYGENAKAPRNRSDAVPRSPCLVPIRASPVREVDWIARVILAALPVTSRRQCEPDRAVIAGISKPGPANRHQREDNV